MDGMEWQRKKYGIFSRMLLRWCEKRIVKKAELIIADHPEIEKYYRNKYNISPVYIPYGADIQQSYNDDCLAGYGLKPGKYFISVARDEPDNQVDEIIEAWKSSGKALKLVIVTNNINRLSKTAPDNNLVIIAGLYNNDILNNLRHFSAAVIHGHKVGGTNPSLLEAMASGSPVIAHDNEFNKFVVKGNALFFKTTIELKAIFEEIDNLKAQKESWIKNNLNITENEYTWKNVAEKYWISINK